MNDLLHPSPDKNPAVPDALAENLAAYALDALPPDEANRVEAHLATDADARNLLAEYRAVVNLLPYGASASGDAPPAPLRGATLARARAARAARSRATPLRFLSRGSRVFAAVAACLVLGALLLGTLASTGGLGNGVVAPQPVTLASILNTPGLVAYEMVPEAIAPGATGRVYLTPDHRYMALTLQGMPPTPEGRAYQLWFRNADQVRESINVFTPDASGKVEFVRPIPPSPTPYITCGITQEPAGGSPGPTGSRVIGTAQWPVSY